MLTCFRRNVNVHVKADATPGCRPSKSALETRADLGPAANRTAPEPVWAGAEGRRGPAATLRGAYAARWGALERPHRVGPTSAGSIVHGVNR